MGKMPTQRSRIGFANGDAIVRIWCGGVVAVFLSALAITALGSLALPSIAWAQACPAGTVAVNGTSCTVAPGSTITVNSNATPGLSATNAGGAIQANGVTVNLGPGAPVGQRNYLGAQAVNGGQISLDNSLIKTIQSETGQTGAISTGAASRITATGADFEIGILGTTASNLTGLRAQNAGFAALTNVDLTMGGGVNGINNRCLVADGVGSEILVTGGSLQTQSRGSAAVTAGAGGTITMQGGTQVSTTGIQSGTNVGSHGLLATGTGSAINATGATITATGNFASGARAEDGGSITLSGSQLSASGTTTSDADPNSVVRAVSGGTVALTNGSTITATGQRANGASADGAGSKVTIFDSSIDASGTRANAVKVFSGASAELRNATLLSSGSSAVVLENAGSSIVIFNSDIHATGALGYGFRLSSGSSGTISGSQVRSEGRDAPGIAAATATLTVTDTDVVASGPDNAMGIVADIGATIFVFGGSVTTSGSSTRAGARAHGLVARNPGGILTASGTSVLTQGSQAFGVVADDGGVVSLTGVTIRTEDILNAGPGGAGAVGIFSVSEQVGAQFTADVTGTDVDVETFGPSAHGADAQARNDVDVETATITLNDSTVTTHGNAAQGLRAVLADYGTLPVSGRGEAIVTANDSVIITEGTNAHGAYSQDNPTTVIMNGTSVRTSGVSAHGSVAVFGGHIVGFDSQVSASGAAATALFVAGEPGHVSNAEYTGSTLSNVSGPTIGVAGSGNVSLSGSSAGGSGQWLLVGTVGDFPVLLGEAPISGSQDPDVIEVPPVLTAPPPLTVTPGLANVLVENSTVTGSAITQPGSVSNVDLIGNSLWRLTGNSNLTNLFNDPSLIDFSPPVGPVTLLSSYKTLTTVNYVGDGGRIAFNTFLASDGAPSDRLIIDGGTATGTTGVIIKNSGGPGAVTTSDGIKVVDAINGATTADAAFHLDGRAVAGPFEYSLFKGGVVDPNDNDWYLRTAVGPGGDPILRPEIGAYLGNSRAAIALFAQTLHERLGEPQYTEDMRKDDDVLIDSFWLRGVGRFVDVDPHGAFTFDANTTMWLIQGGGEVAQWSIFDEDDRLHLGGMVGYGQAVTEVRSVGSPYQARGRAEGIGFGPYATWYENDADKLGLYVDAWAQFAHIDQTVNGQELPDVKYDARVLIASLESGYAFMLRDDWLRFEPQGQIVFTHYDQDNVTEPGGTRITGADKDMFTSRLGFRLTGRWEDDDERVYQPYFEFNWWHDFDDEGVQLSGFKFQRGIPDDRYEVGLGFNFEVDKDWTAWANAEYQFADGNFEGVQGLAGVKFSW